MVAARDTVVPPPRPVVDTERVPDVVRGVDTALRTALRVADDTTDAPDVDARGSTFVAVRAVTLPVPSADVARVATSRTTTFSPRVLAPDVRDVVAPDVVAADICVVREIVFDDVVRWDSFVVWVGVVRLELTVVTVPRRVAARAASSASSAYAP